MPRSLLRLRELRYEWIMWRAGNWPVVMPTRDGEQIGEAT